MEKIAVEIVEHIGVVGTKPNGYTKEVNIVSWNGHKPKIDIRDWDASHERPSRGLTLTEEEAEALYIVLKGRYECK